MYMQEMLTIFVNFFVGYILIEGIHPGIIAYCGLL